MNPEQPVIPTPRFDFAKTLRRNLLRAQCYVAISATQELISYINIEPTEASNNVVDLNIKQYFEQVLRPHMLSVLDTLYGELKDEAINNQKVAVTGVSMVEDRTTNLQTLNGLLTQLYPYTAQL